jgi:hypothetical protein
MHSDRCLAQGRMTVAFGLISMSSLDGGIGAIVEFLFMRSVG